MVPASVRLNAITLIRTKAALIESIRSRLPRQAQHLEILPVAAAPRRAVLLEGGRVRSEPQPAQIAPLRRALL
ncbi:MAG: hypothetical protein ACK2T3_09180, partial [Candidatus Promineifilaceae bacterium]